MRFMTTLIAVAALALSGCAATTSQTPSADAAANACIDCPGQATKASGECPKKAAKAAAEKAAKASGECPMKAAKAAAAKEAGCNCAEGKAGGTVWCDPCGSGYVAGEKTGCSKKVAAAKAAASEQKTACVGCGPQTACACSGKSGN